MAVFGWAKEKFPEAIKKAAYIYIDGEVTRQLAEQDAEGADEDARLHVRLRAGHRHHRDQLRAVVQQIKSKGAEYVTFVGAYQQAAAIAQEMKRQGYKPEVYQPTVTAYTPRLHQAQAGDAAEGTYIAVSASLNEEISSNPELRCTHSGSTRSSPAPRPPGSASSPGRRRRCSSRR